MQWAYRRKRKTKKSPATLTGGEASGSRRSENSASGSQAPAQGFFGGATGINDDQPAPPDKSDDERDAPSTPDNNSPDTRTSPHDKDKENGKGEEGSGGNPGQLWDFLI